MQRVGEFEKVSYEQFSCAVKDVFAGADESLAMDFITDAYEHIMLPTRATSGSAGYDFKSPFPFVLKPGQSIKIPTGIRVKIDDGWWLACLPRSGLGFKYQVRLANTVGVVDSDYYYSSNEGHIFLKFVNSGSRSIEVDAGNGIAQGIFVPYGLTYSDNVTDIRNGGMGSTGN